MPWKMRFTVLLGFLPAERRPALEDQTTHTSRVEAIAHRGNEEQWIARAKQSSRRDLEREVRQVRRRASASTMQASLVPVPDLPGATRRCA
jgi:hypothetical protein